MEAPQNHPTPSLADKHARLREVLRGYTSALVCFSGGADSTLVLRVAPTSWARAPALTAVCGPWPPRAPGRRRLADADRRALDVVDSHELERPGFEKNPTDRCYHCKAELLDIARPHADELGLEEVLLGTNLDDLGDHRPGLRRPTSAARAIRWSRPG